MRSLFLIVSLMSLLVSCGGSGGSSVGGGSGSGSAPVTTHDQYILDTTSGFSCVYVGEGLALEVRENDGQVELLGLSDPANSGSITPTVDCGDSAGNGSIVDIGDSRHMFTSGNTSYSSGNVSISADFAGGDAAVKVHVFITN